MVINFIALQKKEKAKYVFSFFLPDLISLLMHPLFVIMFPFYD